MACLRALLDVERVPTMHMIPGRSNETLLFGTGFALPLAQTRQMALNPSRHAHTVPGRVVEYMWQWQTGAKDLVIFRKSLILLDGGVAQLVRAAES
jgi:hypothetical protein